MAHNVIPILSSSPPPMEGFDEWGEEDFGGFESAPCQNAEKTHSPKPKAKVESTNGTPCTEEISPNVEKNGTGETVPEVTSQLNGVTMSAESVETPSQESVVDSGWGSDGSPLAKSEEFGDFSAGLTVGEEDVTSLNPMSREDSASSSLAGEFKRSGSELVLPDINPGNGDDDAEDDEDTGINMAASVDSDYRVEFGNPEPVEGEEWGALSDSVPESSPEEETIKPFPEPTDSTEPCSETLDSELCNETSTDDQGSTSSHDQTNPTTIDITTASNLHDVPTTIDGITDDCSTTDPPPGVVTSSEVTSSDVTSQSTVTSQREEDGDWFADIRDEVEHGESAAVDETCAVSTQGDDKVADDRTTVADDSATVVEDSATVADDSATVADDSATVADDPATVAIDPATVADDSATVAIDPATVADDSATVAIDPATVAIDPATVAIDPATVADGSATVADGSATVAIDPATVAIDPATVADDPTTVTDAHVTNDQVADDDDDDWDPFTADVADVAPVVDDGWSAFVATETKDDADWSAFGSSPPDFGNFGESSTDSKPGAKETDNDVTESTEPNPETTEVDPETTEVKPETTEVKPETTDVKPETTEVATEITDSAQKEDDFGHFDEAAEMTSQTQKDGTDDSGAGDEFGDFGGGDDDDDFGDFEEPPPVANTDPTVTEQSKPVALAKLTELVAACFPDPADAEPASEDGDFSEITLEEILEKPREEEIEKPMQGNKKPEIEVIDRNVWSRLMDLERTPPCMKVTYRESQIFQQVLKVLDIDPRNILNAKKPSVPVFASNLGLLEPSKPGSEHKPEPLVATTTTSSNGGATPEQGETNIPPVEFDWSGAGLTNPLDSSQSGSSLDLDFFIDTTNKPAIQTKSSALENEFLNPIDLPTKKKALTLDSILGNAIFTSVKKDKSENISSEATKILDKLPDLSFMKAKVLMFPIRSSGNAD